MLPVPAAASARPQGHTARTSLILPSRIFYVLCFLGHTKKVLVIDLNSKLTGHPLFTWNPKRKGLGITVTGGDRKTATGGGRHSCASDRPGRPPAKLPATCPSSALRALLLPVDLEPGI